MADKKELTREEAELERLHWHVIFQTNNFRKSMRDLIDLHIVNGFKNGSETPYAERKEQVVRYVRDVILGADVLEDLDREITLPELNCKL